MTGVKFISCFVFIFIFLPSVPAQQFSVSSSGKVSFTVSQTDKSVTVKYKAATDDAVILISFPFRQSLPADYSLRWEIASSGSPADYRIYIKDTAGTFWRGMKKFTSLKRGKDFINKLHFNRPDTQGFISPSAIDSLFISVNPLKKGKGSVTFRKFLLEELYLTSKREIMPVMLTTSGEDVAVKLLDNDAATYHSFRAGKNQLRLNFHNPRSPGAIAFRRTQTSDLTITVYQIKGKKKKLLAEAVGSRRPEIYIPLPDHETSEYLAEILTKCPIDLSEIELLPDQVNDHPVHLHRIMTGDSLKGFYPRGYTGVPSGRIILWKKGSTIVYINDDGQIELPHAGMLIDPYLRILDETGTWLSAKNTVRYAPDSSRVFHLNRAYQFGELWMRAFVDTVNGTPYLNMILEAANLHHFKIKGKIFAAIRPLSSDPYSAHDLLSPSESGVFSAVMKNSSLVINKKQTLHLFTEPQFTGGFSFLKYDYISSLNGSNTFPPLALTDRQGLGTVLLSYDFTLIPASRRLIFLSLPLEKEHSSLQEEHKNLGQRMMPFLPLR